ncbi:hypothetical protein FEF26_15100 [Nesterenkonia salmonea]|uniref:Uncharacterized protein n=1 Tax=Nesterenkonia salmonea TaxID=1804987 RepID=A0A5R9B6S6_9MICC|nr:hypothetical protein [Nesterenkonia salmonea]TLP92114.1 hypothetical protein FEF26_15100 [Nesterenkonia salmonea]
MSEETRSTADRSMAHFPYFTVALSSKGHEASALPHGNIHVNTGPAVEIVTGEPVRFTLRAADPHGRPMKVQMLTNEQRNRKDFDVHPDRDLVVEWTPGADKHRQSVQFHLRGEHDDMHRINSGVDQLMGFEFIAFPRS